jgi:hypothetical protein
LADQTPELVSAQGRLTQAVPAAFEHRKPPAPIPYGIRKEYGTLGVRQLAQNWIRQPACAENQIKQLAIHHGIQILDGVCIPAATAATLQLLTEVACTGFHITHEQNVHHFGTDNGFFRAGGLVFVVTNGYSWVHNRLLSNPNFGCNECGYL